jgi:Heterokaryon incompatibility protein Het-C
MHELAHVAQTQHTTHADATPTVLGFGGSYQAAELDADRAAKAALRGESYRVSRFENATRGFGATAPVNPVTGQRDHSAIVHENQTEDEATRAGYSDRDAAMIYSGNWQRDMNQLILPKLQQANPVLYELLSIAHTMHFGFPIPNPQEFGTYDPVEHIDNPGGQRGNEIFNQSGENDSASSSVGNTLTPTPTKRGLLGAVMQDHDVNRDGIDDPPAPALANADPRYAATAAGMTGHIENPGDAAAFQVDQSGIPAYLQTSRNRLKQQLQRGLETIAAAGGDSARQDRGLRYAGEALHIMQDYYAHSNFVEIAMNILLESGVTPGTVPGASQPGQPQQRGARPLDLVQVLNLAQDDPRLANPQNRHEINTYVHGMQNGQVDPNRTNMRTQGGRQIMATGTFTLEDTAESLKAKLSGALQQMNPFEKGATKPSKAALAIMTWLEANPPYVGDVSGHIRQLGGILNTAKPGVHVILRGIGIGEQIMGTVEAGLERGVGAVREGFHAATGGVARLLGYSGNEQDQAAQAAHTQTDNNVQAAQAEGTRQRQTAERFLQRYDQLTSQLQNGTGLRDLYMYAYDANQVLTLENLAREIPVVGDQIAEVVKSAVDRIKEEARQALEAVWQRVLRQTIAELDAAISAAIGSTEVHNDTMPQGMTQPTHTDIAKDFDTHQHGTEDTFSVIEEGREWLRRLSGVGPTVQSAERALDGIVRDPSSAPSQIQQFVNEASSQLQVGQPGTHEDENHQHSHRHGGAWLAGLADDMAHRASNAILQSYRNASMSTSPTSGVTAFMGLWISGLLILRTLEVCGKERLCSV